MQPAISPMATVNGARIVMLPLDSAAEFGEDAADGAACLRWFATFSERAGCSEAGDRPKVGMQLRGTGRR